MGSAAVAVGANAHSHNLTPVPTASVVGGTGTYTNGAGAVFAKTGQPITLQVGGTNVACVEFGGVTDSVAPFSFSLTAPATPGLQTLAPTAYAGKNSNNRCNGSSVAATTQYTVDNAAPQLSASLSPAPLPNGWNKGDVTVTWNATDVSGLKSGPTPATDTVTENTGGVTKTSEATDNLGTRGTGTQVVRLDKSAPTISADVSPAPNRSGWNNTDVSVSFACADQLDLSGVDVCPTSATRVVTEGAGQTVSGVAKDFAGNSTTTTASVSIDKTPPTLSGVALGTPTNGWYRGDVEIDWTCGDPGSGVDSCPANTSITGEGAALSSTETIADRAGNVTTATSATVKIDRTPPATSATAPTGWTNADAEVTLSASDGGSGVDVTRYRIGDGDARTYSGGIRFADEGTHTLSVWSVDRAGNTENATTIDVRVDKTAPTLGQTLSPEPNLAGWNKSDVTVRFDCDDATGSGIASCSPERLVTSEGRGQEVVGEARDNAGNSASRTAFVSLDKSNPSISGAADREPNGLGWYRDDVVVSFTCTDQVELSGVDRCPAPVTFGEGDAQAVTRSVLDTAGNEATTSVTGLNVDKTRPTLTGRPTTTPNVNGWYSGDVSIQWTCADSLSGVNGTCPADPTIGGEGDALGVSDAISDKAGNVGHGSVAGIKIDRHAPVTIAELPTPVADGWHSGPVTIRLAADDNLSDVASTHYRIDGGSTQTYTGEFTFDQNGAHRLTFWSVDKAGNEEAPTTVDVKVDTVNPTITGSRPEPNSKGWYNGSVGVSFDCADADSGVSSCSPGVTLSEDGRDQSVSGTVEDLVGNRAGTQVAGINIDTTAPTVTGKTTTAANANGWYRSSVVIDWTCDDRLSGIDGSCPASATVSGEGEDLGTGPVTVADEAGNIGTGSVSGIKIDGTAPTVAFVSPADGATVSQASTSVTVTAADALSGVGTVSIGGTDATSNSDGSFSRSVALNCGVNTVSAVAVDRAGNDSATASLRIVRSCLTAGDALSPLANSTNTQIDGKATNLSSFKIKSVLPVKFRVYKDTARTDLVTTPPSGSTAKLMFVRYNSTTDTSDPIADLVSSGSANTDGAFRWSATDHQYVYNLGTAGRTAGTYGVQLTMYAEDGTPLAKSAMQYFVLRA